MDFTVIIDALVKLVAVVLVAFITYITPKIKTLIESKIGTERTLQLTRIVTTLVKSAEQLYKTEDPTGEMRNSYVKEQLEILGYQVTEEVNALIESAVFNLKK